MPSPEGLRIGNQMFEKYMRLRKLVNRPDIDPDVKKEIEDFLKVFDEYLDFIGKNVRDICRILGIKIQP
jgi:hypothetical protein